MLLRRLLRITKRIHKAHKNVIAIIPRAQKRTYLELPRIHFSGNFYTDVSTVNNDDEFLMKPEVGSNYAAANLPWNEFERQRKRAFQWNPYGSGVWTFEDCKINAIVNNKNELITDKSPHNLIDTFINKNTQRGRLVDLDPEAQMRSTIWGFKINITDKKPLFISHDYSLLNGDFYPECFQNIWMAQNKLDGQPGSMPYLRAVYQSVLREQMQHGATFS